MTETLPLFEDDRIPRIHDRLLACYSALVFLERLDPVSQLVRSILGSRTLDDVSTGAANALRARFGSWEAVRDAPLPKVRWIVRPVQYHEAKALWLQSALYTITVRRGALDLAFLAGWRVDEARAWLETLAGVGPKVSASVLNFSTLWMRALVVDSHHHRVARRLGLLPAGVEDGKAIHRILASQIPVDWDAATVEMHHCLMKLHGQVCCRKHSPRCADCPLTEECMAVSGTSFNAAKPRPRRSSPSSTQLSFEGF
jgi:endonuclease-3